MLVSLLYSAYIRSFICVPRYPHTPYIYSPVPTTPTAPCVHHRASAALPWRDSSKTKTKLKTQDIDNAKVNTSPVLRLKLMFPDHSRRVGCGVTIRRSPPMGGSLTTSDDFGGGKRGRRPAPPSTIKLRSVRSSSEIFKRSHGRARL